MKKTYLILPLGMLVVGCSAITSSPKAEKHKMEMTLHKVRTDLEDLRHDLNSYQIEHHIMEGKLLEQERVITSLKEQAIEGKQLKLEKIDRDLNSLSKKIGQISKKQESLITDLRQLSTHANDTTTALSQYKDKISEFERNINIQNRQLEELVKVRSSLSKLIESSQDGAITYVVKAGDSLEKIAREYQTSVDEIKRVNGLDNDRIIAGQKLIISSGR